MRTCGVMIGTISIISVLVTTLVIAEHTNESASKFQLPIPIQLDIKELTTKHSHASSSWESYRIAYAGGSTTSTSSTPLGPYAKYNRLYLWIFEAKDSAHKPTQAYLEDTINAYARFYQFKPGTLYYYYITGYWDASDVSPSDSSVELLKDLAEDVGWVRSSFNDGDPANDIVIGWVDYMDHNGLAFMNGFFSVAAVKARGLDWPHDSIVQHEISHNFNADDQGFWPWESPECIMNYTWAYWGTDKWCDHCWNIVYGNINGLWE